MPGDRRRRGQLPNRIDSVPRILPGSPRGHYFAVASRRTWHRGPFQYRAFPIPLRNDNELSAAIDEPDEVDTEELENYGPFPAQCRD